MKNAAGRQRGAFMSETLPDHFGRAELIRFGQLLREARTEKGLSLRALAKSTSLSVNAIRNLEQAKGNPSLLTVMAVVSALELPIDKLIEGARRNPARVAVTRGGAPACVAGEDDAGQDGGVPVTHADPRVRMTGRRIRLAPGTVSRSDLLCGSGAYFCFVLSGRVHVSLDGAPAECLAKGDAFHAKPGVKSMFATVPEDSAELLLVADSRDDREEQNSTSEM